MTIRVLRSKISKAARARGHALRWHIGGGLVAARCARCDMPVQYALLEGPGDPVAITEEAITLDCTKDRRTPYTFRRMW
jgi:hypothetical protein